MTRKLLDQPQKLLKQRFQALRDQVGALPETCREDLKTALHDLSQAIAALRQTGGCPPVDLSGGQEAQVSQGDGTPPAAIPASSPGRMALGHPPAEPPARCETILHHLFSAIPDLLIVLDRDLNVIMSNWRGHEFVSEAPGHDRPKCYGVFMHRDRPCEVCHVQEVFANGRPQRAERLNPIDGRRREINAFPIRDEAGQVILVAEHVRDITQSHSAEEALRDSERRFRTFIEDSPESVFHTDAQGIILAASRVAAQRLGKDLKEIIGALLFDLFPPEVAARRRVMFEQAVATGRPLRLEDARGGMHFDVNINPILDADGKVARVSILGIDITDRKNTEQALGESEERFRMLFEHAPDAYILADMQGEIIDCNQATEALAGYGREELIGNNFACLSWLDFRHQVRLADLLAQTARGEVLGPVDFTIIRKDGGEVIAEGLSLPLYIQGQNLVLTIVRDITARRQAEAALREKEERFRHISSTISDISYSCALTPEGSYSIDWMAGAVERITGYSLEEIKARRCWKFLVIEADQPLFEKHITGLAAGTSGTCELRLRHKNGGLVWVASFAEIAREPGQPGLFHLYGGLVDITARKQAEAALAAHLRFLQLLLDTIPSPIFFKDAQGAYLGCNKAFKDFFGVTREGIVGKTVYDISPKELADEYHRMDLEAFQTPGTQVYESRVQAADGSRRHVVFHKATFPDPAGAVGGLVGIIMDITNLKQAEEALRESEARFRAIFEYAPVGIGMADPTGRFLQSNQALLALLGYSADEFKGVTFQEMTHPEDLPRCQRQLEDLLTGEHQYFDAEKRCFRKDGGTVWVQVTMALLRNIQGEPQYLIATVIDITARKKAEESLRQSEQRFRDITEYAAEWVWEVDAQGKYLYSSPVVEQLLGYTPEEVLGKYFYDFFLPDQREKLKKAALAAFAAKQPFRDFHNPSLHKNGQTVWLSSSGIPILDAQGNLLGYRGADIDISERREAEALSRNLIANSPVGIYLIQNKRFQLVNQWFFTITGYSKDEFLNLEPLGLVHPEDLEATRENAVKMLKGLSSVPYEYRSIAKGGETKWIMETLSSVQYQGKRAVLGYFMDITQRKALEAQLLQAQKMEAVGRLAGGVAHDFNNLLMAITGYGELMRSKVHKGDPLYDHLENILKASDRAAALTQQLLTFSRRQIVHPQVIDLNRVVLDLEPMLRRLIGEDLDLAVVTDRRLGAVKADPGQLGQIIMNLVVNARDAMPQGGRLTLKTAAVDFTVGCQSRFGLAPPGSYVMLEVADTGVGMDEATQTHVFEPFFTTKEPGKGTGLGLSTVYGIVKQSGGYLDLASEPGAGSTFTVYLPRLDQVVEPPQVKIPITASFRGEETILLVEDEEVLRGLLAKFLRLYGYTVLEARHGGEALLTCERHQGPIHLMVTDVVMPQMSGRELAERLTPLRPDMKILYMSGYTEDALVQHGVADLSAAFLQKPFKPIDLARRVYAVLHPPADR